MQPRGTWLTPQLTVFGNVADLTRGKLAQGGDEFCGTPPCAFNTPRLPTGFNDAQDSSSTDAIVRG